MTKRDSDPLAIGAEPRGEGRDLGAILNLLHDGATTSLQRQAAPASASSGNLR